MGTIIGDLNSRRAQVKRKRAATERGIIRGIVPLAEMFAMPLPCVRSVRDARHSIWNRATTRKCRAMSRMRSSISTAPRSGEVRANGRIHEQAQI